LAAIYFGLSKSDIAERREKIVAFSELTDEMNTAVKYYSSGMYLRFGGFSGTSFRRWYFSNG
jgi:ABC-type polysaccharide/polyol phosphate transport system ATPase subunit